MRLVLAARLSVILTAVAVSPATADRVVVAFHRSLHISYPNADDRRRATRRRVRPRGAFMSHGLPNGLGALGAAHVLRDWTDGCIALTGAEIEEIWRMVPNGTRIEIRP